MDLSTAIGRLVVIAAVLKRGPRYGFNTTSPMPLALLDRQGQLQHLTLSALECARAS